MWDSVVLEREINRGVGDLIGQFGVTGWTEVKLQGHVSGGDDELHFGHVGFRHTRGI